MKDAINALVEKTEELDIEAKNLKEVTDKKIRRATKEFRILGALLLILILIIGIVLYILAQAYGDIHTNTRDIDTLVTFVQEVQADQDLNTSSQQLQKVFGTVFEIREIICQSVDPGIQAACDAANESRG